MRDLNDDPIAARRRRLANKAKRQRIILAAVVAGMAFMAIIVVGVLSTGRRVANALPPLGSALPDSIRGRDKWTHKDLLEYPNSHGMKIVMRPNGPRTARFLNVANDEWTPDLYNDHAALKAFIDDLGSGNSVTVTLLESEKDAREASGTSDKYWHYGRFVFRTNHAGLPFLAKIQSTLR